MSRETYTDWQERLLQRNSARGHAMNYGMGRREYPISHTARQTRRRERPRMVFKTTPRGGGSFYEEFIRREEVRMSEDTTGREPEATTEGLEVMRRAAAEMHRAQAQIANREAVADRDRGRRLPHGANPDDILDAMLGRPQQAVPETVEPPAPPTIDLGEIHIDLGADVAVEDVNPEEAETQPDVQVQEFTAQFNTERVRTGRADRPLQWQNAFRASASDEPDRREVSFMEVLERANELTILAGQDGMYYATWQTHDNIFGSADDNTLNTLFHKILESLETERSKTDEYNEPDCEF